MIALRRFLAYGLAGLLVENVFTGIASVLAGDFTATTRSYLWMIPIYGAGACAMREFMCYAKSLDWLLRIVYGVMFLYLMEMSAGGLLLVLLGRVPWDYGEGPWTPAGIVNFAYVPFWFALLVAFDWYVRTDSVEVLRGTRQ